MTGASGFVGLPAVAELARRGEQVHALTSRASPPQLAGVRWHLADLGEESAVRALVEELRPDVLLHLAWYVEPGLFWEARENVAWVERSLRLLRVFAEGGGRRAVMLGTCAEYDWSPAQGPLSEDSSPISPRTLYGVAKDATRRVSEALAERAGVELAWARLFFLYGPREAPQRLVPSVIRSLLAGEPVSTTLGTQRRDLLHVEDVARALATLLESAVTGAVNIASGKAITLAEVVDQIALTVARPELVLRGVLADRPGEPSLLQADVRRLREEVGFRPEIRLDEGIDRTVAWWRAQGVGSAVAPAGRG